PIDPPGRLGLSRPDARRGAGATRHVRKQRAGPAGFTRPTAAPGRLQAPIGPMQTAGRPGLSRPDARRRAGCNPPRSQTARRSGGLPAAWQAPSGRSEWRSRRIPERFLMPMPSLLLDLVTAMAIGLLIGIERGWSSRGVADGRLAAGIRTYGLIGLLGGLAALLSQPLGVGAWIAILLAFSALVAISYLGDLRNGDMGMTSEVALLLTFLLGSLALSDQRMLAAGCAVIVALLLSLKDQLHTALQKLSALE